MTDKKDKSRPKFRVGDLVRFKAGHGPTGSVMLVTEIGSDGVFIEPDDPSPMLSHNLIRYWHPKFGDGGWSGRNSFELVAEVDTQE